jgi:hypothetical protein
MPLVFVHGVATRPTPNYQAMVRQRNELFRRLVMEADTVIYDPDWGSGAVNFRSGGWIPEPGATEAFRIGQPQLVGGSSVAAAVATKNLDEALDLAFGVLLAERAETGGDDPVDEDDLTAFAAAVRYLEAGGDRSAFTASMTDDQFAEAVRTELQPNLPTEAVESYGLGDVFRRLGKGLRRVTDPFRDAGSDVVLRFIRKPLSNQVALFLGDIFVYLRWREADYDSGTYARIFRPIIDDLVRANSQPDSERLIVVGHSLGAVILYDLLTDDRALEEIAERSGKPLQIDLLASVGAQPGLFADMGLYDRQRDAAGKLPRPACVQRWINVYDYTDVLSFKAEPFFSGVKDYEFNNVTGVLEAHTTYFQRPSFYKRFRKRLEEA